MSKELLLEIGCEDIPARFVSVGLTQLREKMRSELCSHRIRFGEVLTFGTPRRLAVVVKDVAEQQESWEERRIGPFVSKAFNEKGEPTPAGLGFARSCGVLIEELGREETPKGAKLVYVKKVDGRRTAEVLAELLPGVIRSLEFPKAMRWGRGNLLFVRPIQWVAALLGSDEIPFVLDGLPSGRQSRGHRFMHPAPFALDSAAEYAGALEARNVMVDPEVRRRRIEEEVKHLAAELGGEVLPDAELLAEVTDLVEFPVVLSGKFDPRFLALPPEVPIVVMRAHQRYFAVRRPGTEKELLPCFIAVANTPAHDPSVVVRGNERVLEARLADAEFYWQEDLKKGIEKMRPATAGMLFYKTLGSYSAKSERVESLCRQVSAALFPGETALERAAVEAARYCKADLVSMMVGEFPELQGVMGGEYLRAAGIEEAVAQAVADHYLPRSAEDIAEKRYPRSRAGDILSLADKIDSLAACWAAGLAPTGAGDPFALRRQAQGVLNLLLERQYHLDLRALLRAAANLSAPLVRAEPGRVAREVEEFILGRLRVQLLEAGHRYDTVEAVLAVFPGDVVETAAKVEALSRWRSRPGFDALMIAFRRLMNIIEGEPGAVVVALFQEQAEAVLYSEYTRVRHQIGAKLADRDYEGTLEVMAGLKPAVDRFFEEVLVNVEEPELRRNRHALCQLVTELFRAVADFSRIVIEGENAGSR